MELNIICKIVVLFLHVVPSVSFTTFVFGDSLVDAGNNDYLFTLSKADSPPYGIDFTPSGGQPTGRFTNGRTIADIVGQGLGAKSFPPAYLSPNTQAGEAILGGMNYASGASGILDETGFLFVRHDKVFPTMFIDSMISNLTIQLKRLHELGARKMVVVGVGPLGCIPFVRAFKLLPSGECSREVNSLIQAYNAKLKELLNRLNQEMGPESMLVFANSFDIFMKIIANYRQYGFENADGPCCGGYFPPFICFKSGDSKNSSAASALCSDRSKFVFWDAYHPTEAVNVIVANELLDGDESSTSPMNIRKLYNYNS
ncbi:Lipase, GDSL [Corchorus olitorius]|uniref:Lipase, GDSL n=1 Tax=Corchorus olitorius TaxID=93759 RepID=A0A1R3K6U4_9ROSI|nr:Lipase, GDSL [Corchorus olitorius]